MFRRGIARRLIALLFLWEVCFNAAVLAGAGQFLAGRGLPLCHLGKSQIFGVVAVRNRQLSSLTSRLNQKRNEFGRSACAGSWRIWSIHPNLRLARPQTLQDPRAKPQRPETQTPMYCCPNYILL